MKKIITFANNVMCQFMKNYLKKTKGLNESELRTFVENMPFCEVISTLIDLTLNYPEIQTDTRFPITQEEFDTYFRIKDSKGRGRKRREAFKQAIEEEQK